MKTRLRNAAKEAMNEITSPLHEGVEVIVKRNANHEATDNITSTNLAGVPSIKTELKKLRSKIVGFLRNTLTPAAPVIKLIKRHAEITVTNEKEFNDLNTSVGERKE